MRKLIVLAGLMICGLLVVTAVAQLQFEPGKVPPAPLVNDVDGRPPRGFGGPPARFTIVVLGEKAVLLDTTNGETWSLVFESSEPTGRWKAIPGGPHERRERRPPGDDRGGRGRRPAEGDNDPPGGKSADRETDRK